MNKKVLAYIAITITSLIWGISYLCTRVALTAFSPLQLGFTRFLIATIILFVILMIIEKKIKVDKEDLPRLASVGIIGVAAYAFFENNGIKLTSASSASMIIASVPIFSLIGDWLINKNKLTLRKTISVALSVGGVFLIVIGNMDQNGFSGHIIGFIFMFCAAMSWVTFNFIVKPLYEKYSGLTITFFQILFGMIALAPFAVFHYPVKALLSTSVLLNVLFLAIFCSAIAYFLYIFSLNQLGVTVTTLFVNFLPVVTVVLSFFILKEKVVAVQILGGAIVIFSVCLITLEKKDIMNSKTEVSEIAKIGEQ